MGIFYLLVNPALMEEAGVPEETRASRGRIHKIHTDRPQPVVGLNPGHCCREPAKHQITKLQVYNPAKH